MGGDVHVLRWAMQQSISMYVNSHFERPEVGRELDFGSTASTQPGRSACRGVVGTLLSSPSCVSGLAPGSMATWPRVVAAHPSVGRTYSALLLRRIFVVSTSTVT